MNLNEFLQWIITAGGSTVAATWVLVRTQWYNALDAAQQQWVRFGASGGLSVLALLILNNVEQATLEAIAPYFSALAGAFVIVFLGQVVEVQQRFLAQRQHELRSQGAVSETESKTASKKKSK